MPLEKMSRAEMETYRGGGARVADQEYVRFLRTLKPGEGGRANAKTEGVTRQSMKNRLNKAAVAAGVKIKYLRIPRGGDPDVLLFELDSES
jgi:hypothetical protein